MWVAAAVVFASPLAQPGLSNLIENPTFAGGAQGWETTGAPTFQPAGGPRVPLAGGESPRPTPSLTFAVPSPVGEPWGTMMSQPLQAPIAAGEEVELSFWGKSANRQRVGIMIEEVQSPWTKLISQVFTLDDSWRKYSLKAPLPTSATPGGHRVVFHLSHDPGTLSLAQTALMAKAAPLTPRPSADKPEELLLDGSFTRPLGEVWSLGDGRKVQAEIKTDSRFGRALRLTLPQDPSVTSPWDIQIGQPVEKEVRRGETLYLKAWMRSPQRQSAWLVYELGRAPHTKVFMTKVDLSPEWEEHRLVVKSSLTFAPKDAQFKIFAGTMNGVIEAAQISLANYGPSAPMSLFKPTAVDYRRSKDTTWQAGAAARIQKLRTSQARLQLVGSNGKPLRGVTATATLKKHHFRFGTAVTARWINDPSEDGKAYRRMLESAFNTVVFENDMKWGPMESGNWQSVLAAMDWLEKQGFAIRGHNLVWGSDHNLPSHMVGLGKEASVAAIRARIMDAAQRTNGRLYVWDVVNEAVTERSLWDRIGWDQFTDAFRLSRRLMPNVKLAYNDFNISNEGGGLRHRAEAIKRAQLIQAAGPYLDIFGDQAHMSPPATPISRVLKAWDEVHGALKVPLEITELDFTSWDEQSHGDYIEDYVTAAFSHPAVEAVIFWGFWEGAHWLGAQGGAMVSRDWKPRRSWTLYDRLVNQKWRTKAQLKTTATGSGAFRGFHGVYEVTAIVNGKKLKGTFELLPGQTGPIKAVLTP
jgi:endo-1,4-beta-xylanase